MYARKRDTDIPQNQSNLTQTKYKLYVLNFYRVAQQSKPLPNDKKSYSVILKTVIILDFFVKVKYESSTI